MTDTRAPAPPSFGVALSSLVKKIMPFAPLLASVLPIPGAAAIGQAVAAVFGGNFEEPDELAKIIDKDPAAAVKLAEIQANMRVQLEQLAVTNALNERTAQLAVINNELSKMESDRLDRENARKLVLISRMPSTVSLIILAEFFIIIVIILFYPTENQQQANILYLLFGTLAAAFAAVVNYWLGSSSSSRTKDETARVMGETASKTAETAQVIAQTSQAVQVNQAAAIQTAAAAQQQSAADTQTAAADKNQETANKNNKDH